MVGMARMVSLHMCRSGHECYPLFSGAGSSRVSGAILYEGKTLVIRGHVRERTRYIDTCCLPYLQPYAVGWNYFLREFQRYGE